MTMDRAEITGEMWSAGKSAFERMARRFQDAKTSNEMYMISDIAPAEIYLAMRAPYEAAKEATIQKAADELVHVEEYVYMDEGDIDGAEFAADCVYS